MKKKLALLLSALLLAISLTACGETPEEMDYAGKSYDKIEEEVRMHLGYVRLFSDILNEINSGKEDGSKVDDLAGFKKELDFYPFQNALYLDDANRKKYEIKDADLNGAFLWNEIIDTYGEFSNSDTFIDTLVVTKSGKTTTADVNLVFTNKDKETQDITFEIVYESWNMEVSGITINPVQTMGQKMANAGMNTLISMAIVFAVLVLICLIIYAFNIFPYIEKKKKEKAEKKAALNANINEVPQASNESQPAVEEELTDDYELVAVIAAAIAASEGCQTSDFVVRSINRR